MSLKALVRCFIISIPLALVSPLLMGLLVSITGDENAYTVFLNHYIWIVIAAFILLLIATFAVQLFSPHQSSIAELENDDRETGMVKWFNVNKGYGFITRDNGEDEDVFVHFRAIRGKGHRTLVEGQRVRYYAIRNERGLQAEDVTVIT